MTARIGRSAMVSLLWTAMAAGLTTGCVTQVHEEAPAAGPIRTAFKDAAAQTGVPEQLLLAVGYTETRWRTPATGEHAGDEHIAEGRGQRGMMAVVDRADQPWLTNAAQERGVDLDLARTDPVSNIHIAAQVLKDLHQAAHGEKLPPTVHGWRDALALYGADGDASEGDRYADSVFLVMEMGARGQTDDGELLVIPGSGAKVSGGAFKQGQALTADSSLVAETLPARSGHFHSGRSHSIDRVIIHTTEGSYNGAISWFRSANNPYQTSAHYVIRSSDGEITQMVKEADTAYHVRSYNSRAIGIEHEAFSAQSSWFTDAMYRSSAALVRDICQRNNIPMDRAHIVGHNEIPGNDHSDPGVHWDWDYYMDLVRDGEAAPPPSSGGAVNSAFCASHGGTWCDGDDVVVCQSGDELSRTSCDQGCRSMPSGTPDECNVAVAAPVASEDDAPASSSDGCGSETFQGRCDGDTLVWCQAGSVMEFDCATNGRSCGWQDDSIGNNCLATPPAPAAAPADEPADPCGGETYEGRCDGDTLVWCQSGSVHEVDCAMDGETCGWQDATVGHNCLADGQTDAPAEPVQDEGCGSLTYQGRCDGDTLVWCAGDAVQSYTCADGETCGWQDDDIGYNCL